MITRRIITGKKYMALRPGCLVEREREPQEVEVPLNLTVSGRVVETVVRNNRLLPVGNRVRGDVEERMELV